MGMGYKGIYVCFEGKKRVGKERKQKRKEKFDFKKVARRVNEFSLVFGHRIQ